MSFLDVKNQLMASYMANLGLLMDKKTSGLSVREDPSIDRLVEIRTVSPVRHLSALACPYVQLLAQVMYWCTMDPPAPHLYNYHKASVSAAWLTLPSQVTVFLIVKSVLLYSDFIKGLGAQSVSGFVVEYSTTSRHALKQIFSQSRINV